MTTQTTLGPFQTALRAARESRQLKGYDCLVATADAWQGLLEALRDDGLDMDYTTDEQQWFAGVPAHVAYCEVELAMTVHRLAARGLHVLIVRDDTD